MPAQSQGKGQRGVLSGSGGKVLMIFVTPGGGRFGRRPGFARWWYRGCRRPRGGTWARSEHREPPAAPAEADQEAGDPAGSVAGGKSDPPPRAAGVASAGQDGLTGSQVSGHVAVDPGPQPAGSAKTPPTSFHRPTGYPLGKRAASHEPHHQIGLAILLARVVNRRDGFMFEGGDHPGLSLETSSELCIADERPGQELQGDMALEARVAGVQDGGHPASGNLIDDLISINSFGDHAGARPEKASCTSFFSGYHSRGFIEC